MVKDFLLQKGEKIILDIEPEWNLFYLWVLDYSLVGVMLGGVAGALFALFVNGMVGFLGAVFSWLLVILTAITIGFVAAWLRFSKIHYWVTNHRVVHKRGMIGYSISSIPLERISEVTVSHSFVEQLFRFGSVHVQTRAGQSRPSKGSGEGVKLEAIPEPEKMQRLLSNLLRKRR